MGREDRTKNTCFLGKVALHSGECKVGKAKDHLLNLLVLQKSFCQAERDAFCRVQIRTSEGLGTSVVTAGDF